MRSDRDAFVYTRQVEISYSQTTTAVTGNIAVGALLIWIFWEVTRHTLLLGWFSCLLVAVAARCAVRPFFFKRSDNEHIRRWGDLFVAGNFLTGAIWAFAWLAFIPGPHPVYAVVVAAWIVGMSAAAVAAYSAHIKALLAFCTPVVIPGVIHLLVIGGRINIALGMAICVYSAVMLRAVLPINRSIVKAIAMNFALEAEIEVRKTTEEKLHALSTKDGLTGLANRRRFDEVLEEELRRATRGSAPLSLVMIDIDCFKAFNDRYGHLAGDDCLRRIADVVERTLRRPGDLAARYGGEELAVILPLTGLDAARGIAEHMREEMLSLQIPHEATLVAGTSVVSFSAGVATAPPATRTRPADLISQADAALYRAKSEGRNRVVAATPP